jgi:hypothetical protein
MPRKARLFLPGATYHVDCRVARGEFVFDDTIEALEFTTLAISRYGLRVCDVAALIQKHRSSVTLWLNKGLFTEKTTPEFARRLDRLDEQISRLRRQFDNLVRGTPLRQIN